MDQSKPALLENEKFSSMGQEKSYADVDACIEIADRFVVKRDEFNTIGRRSLLTSLAGAATGAVSGAIVGGAGRSSAAGASVGALVGFFQSLLELSEHSPQYQRFVENCLNKQGYEVVGWKDREEKS